MSVERCRHAACCRQAAWACNTPALGPAVSPASTQCMQGLACHSAPQAQAQLRATALRSPGLLITSQRQRAARGVNSVRASGGTAASTAGRPVAAKACQQWLPRLGIGCATKLEIGEAKCRRPMTLPTTSPAPRGGGIGSSTGSGELLGGHARHPRPNNSSARGAASAGGSRM
jgi:hypothetical protein